MLQQQGRVQVDADWNEQLAIQHHRTETESRDVIGLCGVPKQNGGFKIEKTPDGSDLTISPGRIYVDGLLCESEATPVPVSFTRDNQTVQGNQAIVTTLMVDDRELQPGQWVEISAASKPPKLLQITAVSKGVLTFSEDITDYRIAGAAVRRVATYITQPDYPNPDFTTPLTSPLPSPPGSPPGGFQRLRLSDGAYLVYLDAWQREITALDDPRIREVALGGPDTATRLKTVWQVKFLRVTIRGEGQATCETPFNEWNDLTAPGTGKLNARTKAPEDTKNPCLLPPSAGYRRLENQLYRVEVHTGGPRDAATFKWSRDNAMVETRVEKIAGNNVTVSDMGKDEVLGFANGQWVEVVDDESELKAATRQLAQIDSLDPALRKITMKQSLAALENRARLKLRRWDQNGNTATANGVKVTADWIDLEGGIQVQFSEGNYKSGDYWLIPARTATGEIEWPPFEIPNTQPIPQPPAGIKHHYCRLALAVVNDGVPNVTADCRELFPPLTDICAEDVCFDNSVCDLEEARTVQDAINQLCRTREREPGIHIVAVDLLAGQPLRNDTEVPVNALTRGIRVLCDEDIHQDSVRGKPTCFVTLDLPFPFNNIDRQLWGDLVIGFQPLILAASVNADDRAIFWMPARGTQVWLEQRLFIMMNELRRGDRVLAHLTLKGNFIWAQNNPDLYLDGNVFGFQQRERAITDLRLPSGDGGRGGDFEMWFWLVAAPAPPLLKVRGVQILSTGPDPNNPNPTVLGTLTVSPLAPPSITVPFSTNAIPNAIEVRFTAAPDQNSFINGQSFIVANANGAVLAGQFLFRPDNTVRWVVQLAGVPGLTPGPYRVTLRGNGSSVITAQGAALDGEPVALPSGNNAPGGDFSFELRIG